MSYVIKTSPTNYAESSTGGIVSRTKDPAQAKKFSSEAEARQWWAHAAPTLPPLPPLGEGETIRLERL